MRINLKYEIRDYRQIKLNYEVNKMTKNNIQPKFFTCVSFKSNNDGTSGFRFNILGTKGLVRRRKKKSNGLKLTSGDCFNSLHMFKTTIHVEKKRTIDPLGHFAG